MVHLRAGIFTALLVSLAGCGGASAFLERSPRPQARPPAAEVTRLAATAPRTATYDQWITGFRGRALSQGVSVRTFDRAFAGVGYNADSIRRDRHQPEFTRPIWGYLDTAVSDTRIDNGRRALRDHGRTLAAIEARYGVEKEVVAAIWGLESSYGSLRGNTPIIESLATLAYEGRRRAFFEQQLIAALQILQAGDTTPERMVGSWAGAMGHTQFIPTSYLDYAVDFTGDGRRDIWSDDPTDALASAAAYLSRFGWQQGQPALVEVRLPSGFNPRLAGSARPVQDWAAMGVQSQRGGRLPGVGEATLMFPAGANGPAFLTFRNFQVIKRYNNADAYAIAIAHLADRLRGAGPFVAAWPRDDRPLNASEREELQRLLARTGHYQGEIDGRIGSGSLAAVRSWQAANGVAPDGYVSLALLQRLRR
ncbi:lytic murein transglycosylase [Pararhodobacter sp. SW119]|uniref:lytic murein transglycosylase n=1 Tax=Pararhodobacter sp. SW119 TaxID=2780075 RepID=UPI001ADF8335|nr:lytic murein transglycosylase [Pararhodobacter sp. SW119]